MRFLTRAVVAGAWVLGMALGAVSSAHTAVPDVRQSHTSVSGSRAIN